MPATSREDQEQACRSLVKIASAHMESRVACDFFSKPVYTLRGKFDAYVLVFLHLGSRRVYMSQPTFRPDEAWVMQ